MLIPSHHLIRCHLHRWFRGPEAIEAARKHLSVPNAVFVVGCPHFDISPVDTNIPLHNKTIKPVRATTNTNLVRVKNRNTAFHGGSLALADFQLTPPFGKSMVAAEKVKRFCQAQRLLSEERLSKRYRQRSDVGRNEWNGPPRPKGGRWSAVSGASKRKSER